MLVFDVNETLLDLSVLQPGFDRVFGDGKGALREWFATLLHGSTVANHLGRYETFGAIGINALVTVAERRGVAVDADDVAALLGPFRALPPHPDVLEGLTMLQEAGFRMAALTNTSYDQLVPLLTATGIAAYLEEMLSVDEVRRFKPAPEVYLMAAAKLGIEIDQMVMVAAHDWDIMGARSVGAKGAFIARPGAVWGFTDALPKYVGGDLIEVASQLIAVPP